MSSSLVAILAHSLAGQEGLLAAGAGIGGYDMLLQNESVQKELKIESDQIIKVKEIIRGVRRKYSAELEKLRDLNAEEKRAKVAVIFRTVSRETLERLTDALKPDQIKRLKQIHLQQQGLRAFSEPQVDRALGLSREQKAKIEKLEEAFAEELEKLFQEGTRGGFVTRLKKMLAIRRKAMDQGQAVLTAEQKKAWKELVGDSFEIKLEKPESREPSAARALTREFAAFLVA
jgi:hypothetical protein